MARIAIDARKLGDFGIGTYLEVLLQGLARSPGAHEYLIFLDGRRSPTLPEGPFVPVNCRAGQYGLAEHVELPLRARQLGADLLHSPHYVLPLARRAPTVATLHDLIHLRFPQYLSSPAAAYARWMLPRAWRRASRVITVSRFSREDMVREFGERAGVEVIPNGVLDLFFERAGEEREEALLRQLDLPPPGERLPFVLTPGNVKPHKNHHALLGSFRRLTREHDVELVLTGNAPESYVPLRERARELGVAERVRWLGWVSNEQLHALYRQCALLALPSLYEGFGLPVAEAMASGAPVVAAKRAALPEVAGGAALLVDPADEEALAAAMAELVSNGETASRLRARGERVAENYRALSQAGATRRVYEELVSES